MKYILNSNNNPVTDKQECVVVSVFSDNKKVVLSDAGVMLDKASNGEIKSILDKGDFKADVADTLMLYDITDIKASRVLFVGCGNQEEFTSKVINKLSQAAIKVIQKTSIKSISSYLT
jgi:leucyl aminopeptidase